MTRGQPKSLKQLAQHLVDEIADLITERDALRTKNARLERKLAGAFDQHGVRLDSTDEEQ